MRAKADFSLLCVADPFALLCIRSLIEEGAYTQEYDGGIQLGCWRISVIPGVAAIMQKKPAHRCGQTRSYTGSLAWPAQA
jgi:hypothetical protein